MLNSKEHGIKAGDRVQFTHANIFDIKPGPRMADFDFNPEYPNGGCNCAEEASGTAPDGDDLDNKNNETA